MYLEPLWQDCKFFRRHQTIRKYRIAIIDIAFDLSKFNKKNIISPLNCSKTGPNITKIPMFNENCRLKYNNHGTNIIELFIGKNGLMKNAEIVPIQIHSCKDMEQALDHAIKNKVKAISISLSFNENDRPLAIKTAQCLSKTAKNIPIFIAAGNDGLSLESTVYGRSMIKLCKQSSNIWLVGATIRSFFGKQHSSFSNYCKKIHQNLNNNNIFLLAPGENILITYNFFETNVLKRIFHKGHSGTSIATPLALIRWIIKNK